MTCLPLVTRGVDHRRLKYRRSRNGCLTCKRRKVRCNEQKPECFHCLRLSLECVWKDTIQRQSPKDIRTRFSESTDDGPSPSGADFAQSVMDPPEDFSLFQDIYLPDFSDFGAVPARLPSTHLGPSSPHVPPQSPTGDVDVEDSIPLHVPPILDPVESGPKGASVRALFDSLAASSSMVRYSIAVFAVIQLSLAKKTLA